MLETADGVEVVVWRLDTIIDDADLADWANSFRERYCLDSELDGLRRGPGLSRSEYLRTLIFPDAKVGLGPATRAGDFTELLISDYVEHELDLWVPREKYLAKANPNESVQGVDVLGLTRVVPGTSRSDDVMLALEVKARLTGAYKGQLQQAINDSSKDYLRSAYTLNATKRRLQASGDADSALVVERFQNKADRPFEYRSAAVAVLSDSAFDEIEIATSTVLKHNNVSNLTLMIVRGSDLMTLVHALYDRAADEA